MKRWLFFVVIFLFAACVEEDEVPFELPTYTQNVLDTVKPRPYFPVYPGSRWEYREVEFLYENINPGGNDAVFVRIGADTSFMEVNVAAEYLPHAYITASHYDYNIDQQIETYSDSVLVPFVDGEPIYGYQFIDFRTRPPFGYETFMLYPFLSEQLGFEFIDGWYDNRFAYIGPTFRIEEKLMNSQGDSILIVFGEHLTAPFFNEHKKIWKHYQKNVGLTFDCTIDESKSDTLVKRELVQYFIND